MGARFSQCALVLSLQIAFVFTLQSRKLRQCRSSNGYLLFLGSGSSTAVPRAACLTDTESCRTCSIANQGDPRYNRNYRCNPSIIIHDYSSNQNILIDCGKTFREACMRWFLPNNITQIDSVIITHGHADALLGADDLRGCQNFNEITFQAQPIPVYMTEATFSVFSSVFPYLIPKPVIEGEELRKVAQLDFHMIESDEFPSFTPTEAFGFTFTAFPVMHGEDMQSLGFIIDITENESVVYISDISRILPESQSYLDDYFQTRCLSVLIVDCLFHRRIHNTHFNLAQSLEFIKRQRPVRALLLGLSDTLEYYELRDMLRVWSRKCGICVEPSYDGLRLEL